MGITLLQEGKKVVNFGMAMAAVDVETDNLPHLAKLKDC